MCEVEASLGEECFEHPNDDPSEPPPTVYPIPQQGRDQAMASPLMSAVVFPTPPEMPLMCQPVVSGLGFGSTTWDGFMYVPTPAVMAGPTEASDWHGDWMAGYRAATSTATAFRGHRQPKPKRYSRARSVGASTCVADREAPQASECPVIKQATSTVATEQDTQRKPPPGVWMHGAQARTWGQNIQDLVKQPDLSPGKVTCDTSVQCDLLPTPMPHKSAVCENCGMISVGPEMGSYPSTPILTNRPCGSLPEVPSQPEYAAWGPANDWSWYFNQRSHQLAPAPLTPPPLPPQGASEIQMGAGEVNGDLDHCLASPATTAASESDLIVQLSPSDAGNVDFCKGSSDQSFSKRLLARFGKRCREVQRLEERLAQGGTLNADQQDKIDRLGPLKFLQASMEWLEAVVPHDAEEDKDSDCDSTGDDEGPSCAQSSPTPVANDEEKLELTIEPQAARQLATKENAQSSVTTNMSSYLNDGPPVAPPQPDLPDVGRADAAAHGAIGAQVSEHVSGSSATTQSVSNGGPEVESQIEGTDTDRAAADSTKSADSWCHVPHRVTARASNRALTSSVVSCNTGLASMPEAEDRNASCSSGSEDEAVGANSVPSELQGCATGTSSQCRRSKKTKQPKSKMHEVRQPKASQKSIGDTSKQCDVALRQAVLDTRSDSQEISAMVEEHKCCMICSKSTYSNSLARKVGLCKTHFREMQSFEKVLSELRNNHWCLTGLLHCFSGACFWNVPAHHTHLKDPDKGVAFYKCLAHFLVARDANALNQDALGTTPFQLAANTLRWAPHAVIAVAHAVQQSGGQLTPGQSAEFNLAEKALPSWRPQNIQVLWDDTSKSLTAAAVEWASFVTAANPIILSRDDLQALPDESR